jgi:hypothetical protein
VQQLEVLDPPRARDVRPAAQVHERAVGVDRDDFVRTEVVDALELERVVREAALRLLPRHLLAYERVIRLHDFAHLGLDALQVLRRERRGDLEVVVEPVFDGGTEPDLGVREKVAHRRREHVGAGVAEHVERLGVFVREHGDLRPVRQRARQVPHLTVHAHGEGGLGQARADRAREVGPGGAGGQSPLTPVGERDADPGGGHRV